MYGLERGAFIMHGTNIGNGSIVGAKSVVKGQFPNNCSIGGNPAKIVRRDCAWARDIVTEDIKKCGRDEYFMKTSADNNTADVHKKMKILQINIERLKILNIQMKK